MTMYSITVKQRREALRGFTRTHSKLMSFASTDEWAEEITRLEKGKISRVYWSKLFDMDGELVAEYKQKLEYENE